MTSPTTSTASTLSNEMIHQSGMLVSSAVMSADSDANRSFPSLASSSVSSVTGYTPSHLGTPCSSASIIPASSMSGMSGGVLTPIAGPMHIQSGHPRKQRDICRHWARGYCNRGTVCGFLHADPLPQHGGAQCKASGLHPHAAAFTPMSECKLAEDVGQLKSTVACKDFSVGKCMRGDKCKFTHVLTFNNMRPHYKPPTLYPQEPPHGPVYYHTTDLSSNSLDSYTNTSGFMHVNSANAYRSEPMYPEETPCTAMASVHQPYRSSYEVSSVSHHTPSPYAQPFTPAGWEGSQSAYDIPTQEDNSINSTSGITKQPVVSSTRRTQTAVATEAKSFQHRPYG